MSSGRWWPLAAVAEVNGQGGAWRAVGAGEEGAARGGSRRQHVSPQSCLMEKLRHNRSERLHTSSKTSLISIQ
ncbi:hypothetical protein E2C01_027305 [Portunus trituberculatus]|uniref:Uncharacterized protein n=1 Tax=Portunus trituberculatus TaxID=210409 RepID=A0A5B7EL69_PORTR|nr:hypothetical protein [Portunus trituberculatus]